MRKHVILIVICVWLTHAVPICGQTTDSTKIVEQKVPSIVVLPSSISKAETFAVLFVLPYTGSVSSKYMRVYFNDWNASPNWQKDYDAFYKKLNPTTPLMLVMVSGLTSKNDHDAKGFANAISRFDYQLKTDLKLLEQKYKIDKSKLYLTGFSLGGDMSWAISQKNPTLFKGLVIAGTRCGYRGSKSWINWKQNNLKVFLGIGQHENEVIKKGVALAQQEMTTAGIDYRFYEVPNVAHKMMSLEKFIEGLQFVMEENSNLNN